MVWHKAVDDPRHHHHHHQKPLEPPASPLGLGGRGSQVWWNCGWFWMKIESFTSRVVGQPHNPKSVRHTLRSARSGWHGSSSFCNDDNDINFDGNWVLPDQQRRNIPDCLFSVLFIFHQLFLSPSPPHNGWAAHRAPGVPADQGLEKAHLEKYLQKLEVYILNPHLLLQSPNLADLRKIKQMFF